MEHIDKVLAPEDREGVNWDWSSVARRILTPADMCISYMAQKT